MAKAKNLLSYFVRPFQILVGLFLDVPKRRRRLSIVRLIPPAGLFLDVPQQVEEKLVRYDRV